MGDTQTTTSAPIVTQYYDLSGFTSISNQLVGNVQFTQATTFSVAVSAPQSVLDIISVEVNNADLVFEFTSHAPFNPQVTIAVSAPSLEGYVLGGTGNFTAAGALSSAGLSLSVNGNGNINIPGYTGASINAVIAGSGNITVSAGAVPTESLNIKGMGNIDLSGVAATNVTTNTSGNGNISVNVSTSLDVKISGKGNVYYTGNAVVTQKITGMGKVIHQ